MSVYVEQPGSQPSLPLTSCGNSGRAEPQLPHCNMGVVTSPHSCIQWMFSSASTGGALTYRGRDCNGD